MDYKEMFSADEWKTLQYALMWIFHAIANVDGYVDENEGAALMDALKGEVFFTNELIRQVLDSYGDDPKVVIAEYEKDGRVIPMGLKQAAELVEQKLDAEAATDFKRTLLYLGVVFAKASDEIPGETAGARVSVEEKAAILTTAAILRLSLEDILLD